MSGDDALETKLTGMAKHHVTWRARAAGRLVPDGIGTMAFMRAYGQVSLFSFLI
jgi:hypothetical protein